MGLVISLDSKSKIILSFILIIVLSYSSIHIYNVDFVIWNKLQIKLCLSLKFIYNNFLYIKYEIILISIF